MAHHFVEKETLVRANRLLALSLVWGGLAICAIAASVYDVGRWVNLW
jgi:hypothetical protein